MCPPQKKIFKQSKGKALSISTSFCLPVVDHFLLSGTPYCRLSCKMGALGLTVP